MKNIFDKAERALRQLFVRRSCWHNFTYEFGSIAIRYCRKCGNTQRRNTLNGIWEDCSREEFDSLKSSYSNYA